MVTFLIGGAILAVVAAMRGVWSPCGLSMISTITPLSERARGHRFWVTAAWFTVGGLAGGLTLGMVMALGAWAIAVAGAGLALRTGLLGAAALLTIGSDIGIPGLRLWNHPRQVDETWLRRYRAWAYAAGFGWQIGTGVATYVMTAGVYLLAVLGMLSADPRFALLLGAGFGVVRGLGVLVAVRATTPDRLRRLHATIDRLAPASLVAAVLAQVAVGVLSWPRNPAFTAGIVLLLTAVVLVRRVVSSIRVAEVAKS